MSKRDVWLPKGFNLERAYDLQALSNGVATDEQQKRALKFIVENLCETYGETFDADNARLDSYNQGRRWVGLAIVQIVKLNLTLVANSLKPKEPKK